MATKSKVTRPMAPQDGRICMVVEANRGLVNRTKCNKQSVLPRCTTSRDDVTCTDCLAEIEAGRTRVAAASAAKCHTCNCPLPGQPVEYMPTGPWEPICDACHAKVTGVDGG